MPTPDVSLDAYYKLAVAGFHYELRQFVRLVLSRQFRITLPLFIKQNKFIALQKKAAFKLLLNAPSENDGFSMKAHSQTERERAFYYYINLAAACAFFKGWNIPVAELSKEKIDSYLHGLLATFTGGPQEIANNIAERLNRADTLRVSMALKLLGLLPHKSHVMKQLSLGASLGFRDSEYMHQQPLITPSLPIKGKVIPPLVFSWKDNNAEDIVLIDLDPGLSQHYAALNKMGQGKVLAINSDVIDGMNVLEEIILAGEKAPRDLVILFRMEPIMLTDVNLFFRHLSKVIAEQTRFIMTVGSGDTENAYHQRKDKMDEVMALFNEKGFRVERLKWCDGDTPKQQVESPLLGLGSYCSYDIIYAELIRDKL